jgi:hypothetical protein
LVAAIDFVFDGILCNAKRSCFGIPQRFRILMPILVQLATQRFDGIQIKVADFCRADVSHREERDYRSKNQSHSANERFLDSARNDNSERAKQPSPFELGCLLIVVSAVD